MSLRVLMVSSMYRRLDQRVSANYQHHQVLALRRRGIDVRVLCPIPYRFRRPRQVDSGEPLPDRHTVDGVVVHHALYRSPPLSYLPRWGVAVLADVLLRACGQLRQEFPFDLVHATRLYPTVVAAVRAKGADVPLVAVAVGSDVHTHPQRGSAWLALTREAIARADQVMAVSDGLAGQLAAVGSPARPVRVAYNGVDADTFVPALDRSVVRRQLGLPQEGPGICMVGRLSAEKGLWEMISAFQRIVQACPLAWLTLVGDGPLREVIRKHVKSKGLDGRVWLPGPQPHGDLAPWFQAADIATLASHNEGLPNVVLEAMAAGLPVVATDVGGTAEAVRDGTTGFLVPRLDVDRLAGRLLELVENRALRETMGQAGRKRVLEQFTWDRSAETLERIYRDLTATASPSPAV